MKTNELYANVQATMAEINELLAKSMPMPMQKDDMEAPEAGAPDQEGAPAPEGLEAQAEQESAEAPEAEGAEGEDQDEMAELAAHAQSLSDEELDQMIQLLMQEKDTRGAAQAPEAEGQMAPPAAPQDMEAQKAMKEDYAKMHKSMSVVIESLEKLTKEVESIKAKPAAKAPVQKAVVTNSQQVMQKSGSAPAKSVQRLSKSETESFLLGRMRVRDPNVNTRTITDLGYVNSDAELASFQDSLAKQGVEFPKF
jgi:hypothetical protein